MSVKCQNYLTLSLQATCAISRRAIPLHRKLECALETARKSNSKFEERQKANPDLCCVPTEQLISELRALQKALNDISDAKILHMQILHNRLPQAKKLVTKTEEFLRNLSDEVSQAYAFHTHAPSLMLSHIYFHHYKCSLRLYTSHHII